MLVLTRTVGSVIYGGQAITDEPEDSYDHMIRVERIVDTIKDRYAEISVTDHRGRTEYRLDAQQDNVRIDQIRVVLIGIRHVLDQDGKEISLARIGVDAPRTYRVLRDNAKKRDY